MPQLTQSNRTQRIRKTASETRSTKTRSTNPRGHAPAYDRDGQARYRPSTRTTPTRATTDAARRRVAAKSAPLRESPSAQHQINRRRTSKTARFFQGWSIEKTFTLLGLVTGVAMMVAFALELAFAWPVNQATMLADITFMLSGVVLLLLSLNVASDQVNGRGRIPTRFHPQRM